MVRMRSAVRICPAAPKSLKALCFQGFFFCKEAFRNASFFVKLQERMRYHFMRKKLNIREENGASFEEVWASFIISKTSSGVSEATIRNYHTHLKGISKHLDITMPLERLTRRELEEMVVSMRESGLAHNTVATYLRVINTFLSWCEKEGYPSVSIPNIREKDTVKEIYTDEELSILLKKPAKNCDFTEYRNWVIVNFLLNSGCRAASVRNIQNGDVDLQNHQIVLRHTKNGKIMTTPLCSQMTEILRDYMKLRKGNFDDYLFCNQFGEPLTENGLRLAIAHYNKSRGVNKTSIHLFRHTFAKKYLVDCNGNAFTLQRLLGHSTLTMSKRYCNIYDTDIAKNFDNFSPLAQISRPKEKIKI